MKFVDLSVSSRISGLMDLTKSLRNCRSPYDALLRYCMYLGEAYPTRAQLVLSTKGLAHDQYRVWRLRTDDGAEHFQLGDPWKDFDLPVYSGGVLAKITETPDPHLVHDLDWSDDPHFAQALAPYRSLIAVPLFNERLPLNWSLMLTRDPEQFAVANLEDSVSRAALVGSLLESLFVGRELAQAHAHIDAELERMARIQRALLPKPIPDIPGLQIAASYETFTQVGGDLYDFIRLDGTPERWCAFIGDASGHGPSAAVTSAMVQATLHAFAAECAGPAQLFQKLNVQLCRKRIEGSFLTAFTAFYEPSSRRLTYCSAGHPPPMLPANGRTIFLDAAGGLPLGILDDASYDDAQIVLNPGQTLLLYTDGITEARGKGDDMFGAEGIAQSLRECDSRADCVIDALRKSLALYQCGRRPVDDQTAVAIHVRSS